LEISIEMVKELRNQCSAGVMECRNALFETEGDLEKALQVLKEKGLLKAEKKVGRATGQGLVEAYIHTGGRIGALVEINCETDFVARTDEWLPRSHRSIYPKKSFLREPMTLSLRLPVSCSSRLSETPLKPSVI